MAEQGTARRAAADDHDAHDARQAGAASRAPTDDDGASDAGLGTASRAPTLGDIVGAFKSLAARAVNDALDRSGPVWQRNYYERIIRNERELHATRAYILDNPRRWAFDDENPEAGTAND